MNRQAAITAMRDGHKVSHPFFEPHEFIYMDNGRLYDEKNVKLNWVEFWEVRNSEKWDKDWHVMFSVNSSVK